MENGGIRNHLRCGSATAGYVRSARLLDERSRQFASFWSMIKSELIERISSQNPHLFQRDIEKVVNAIFDEVVEALRRGDRVELRGFGAFSARLRGPHQARNPLTGAVVAVARKAWPYFRTGKKMRVRLNPE